MTPWSLPQVALDFAQEMCKYNANWQLNTYGQTMHAFTNPEANDPSFGTVYSEASSQRAWTAMRQFLQEIFI